MSQADQQYYNTLHRVESQQDGYIGRYGSLSVLLFLKFVANFIQAAHYLNLPINIAICFDTVVPLKENDAIMVVGIYCCMGFLALIIKMAINSKKIDNLERDILVGAAILTVIGLTLQLKIISGRNIYVCLFGFIISYIAINIMDGALIGLIT
jgi:hypothetical protein